MAVLWLWILNVECGRIRSGAISMSGEGGDEEDSCLFLSSVPCPGQSPGTVYIHMIKEHLTWGAGGFLAESGG